MVESLQSAGDGTCTGAYSRRRVLDRGVALGACPRSPGIRCGRRYRRPGEADAWPAPDVILFAPATFNSVQLLKALGLTSAFVRRGRRRGHRQGDIHRRHALFLNAAYAQHPQFEQSIEVLRTRRGERALWR